MLFITPLFMLFEARRDAPHMPRVIFRCCFTPLLICLRPLRLPSMSPYGLTRKDFDATAYAPCCARACGLRYCYGAMYRRRTLHTERPRLCFERRRRVLLLRLPQRYRRPMMFCHATARRHVVCLPIMLFAAATLPVIDISPCCQRHEQVIAFSSVAAFHAAITF